MITQLKLDVKSLAIAGGRPVGSAGHLAAQTYLQARLQSLNLRPYHGEGFTLPYLIGDTQFTNLVARMSGTGSPNGALLIGAHYDTCGATPGADDNAAAVAIVLEVVSLLQQTTRRRDVIVAIFDAEEPPYFLSTSMGSIHFYDQQRTGPIDCAFILDLVGHDVPLPGLEDSVFITGMESHQVLAEVVEQAPSNPKLRTIPTLNEYVGDMSDHHIFRTNGVPFLFFSCGRWQHYHALTDTPDRLNYVKMEATARTLAAMMIASDQRDFSGATADYDSTPVELRLMNRALETWLKSNGMPLLQNRSHITALASRLAAFGL